MWVENCKDGTPWRRRATALDSNCRVHVVVAEGAGHAHAIHHARPPMQPRPAPPTSLPRPRRLDDRRRSLRHAMQNNEIRSCIKCSVKGDVQVASPQRPVDHCTMTTRNRSRRHLRATPTSAPGARTSPVGPRTIETEPKSVGCVSGCTTVVKRPGEGISTSTTVNGPTSTNVNGKHPTTSTGSSTSTRPPKTAPSPPLPGQTNRPQGRFLRDVRSTVRSRQRPGHRTARGIQRVATVSAGGVPPTCLRVVKLQQALV
jgi:hypothetical protein